MKGPGNCVIGTHKRHEEEEEENRFFTIGFFCLWKKKHWGYACIYFYFGNVYINNAVYTYDKYI